MNDFVILNREYVESLYTCVSDLAFLPDESCAENKPLDLLRGQARLLIAEAMESLK